MHARARAHTPARGSRSAAVACCVLVRVASKRGAAAARWSVLPDADPSASALADDRSGDERYRADYLRRDLEEKPFARRGLAATWVLPLGSLSVDTERRPNDRLLETERRLGPRELGLEHLDPAARVALRLNEPLVARHPRR